jgi:hypothetical protein
VDQFYDLLCPVYKDHVLGTLRKWADYQEEDSQEVISLQVATIKRMMVNPLDKWLAKQKRKNTATDACVTFLMAIDEIILGFNYYGVEDHDIDDLDHAWCQFLIYADGGGLANDKAQSERAKKSRGGDKILDLVKSVARSTPGASAKELWPHMYSALEEYFRGDVGDHSPKKRPITEWHYSYYNEKAHHKTLKYTTFRDYLKKVRKNQPI